MDLQTSFGVLSEVIERYESRGRSVRDVEASAADGVLRAELDMPLSLCSSERGPTLIPETATLTDEGRLQVEFAPPELPTPPLDVASLVSVERQEIDVDGDRPVLSVELAIEPTGSRDAPGTARPHADADTEASASADEEPAAESPPESGLAAARDESVPPYEDTPYLRALYEACDTFTEMSRHIEMDVVSETVRRYMIEAGIHDPTPYDTTDATTADEGAADSSADDGSPTDSGDEPSSVTDGEMPDEQLVADGVGLPEHLSMGDVATAVVESVTVYEVQRRLGLGQRRTRELLDQLNLLDLVLHRVASDPEREVTRNDVVARIRRQAHA